VSSPTRILPLCEEGKAWTATTAHNVRKGDRLRVKVQICINYLFLYKKKLVRRGHHLFNALPLLRNVVCVIGMKIFIVLFSTFVKNPL
jgi:hypothetical protein